VVRRALRAAPSKRARAAANRVKGVRGLGECSLLVDRQSDLACRSIRLGLLERRCSRYDDDVRTKNQPREGDLRARDPVRGGDIAQDRDEWLKASQILWEKRGGGPPQPSRGVVLVIATRQESLTQGHVGNDHTIVFSSPGKEILFGGAV